jgi:2-polyprenyl-6-methoxyphenol hydroxylase-like FAD-dependent oxidoreductase
MHDVIIVGARVAGSATALLLARAGLEVLVVDRATFPSDTLSTHQVQVPGVARLARWGVLDPIMAAGTPPTRTVRFDQGAAAFSARMPASDGVDMMCSPRRTLLDKVLLDAAGRPGLRCGRTSSPMTCWPTTARSPASAARKRAHSALPSMRPW